MSNSSPQSNRPMHRLADCFPGGEPHATESILTGPVEPKVNRVSGKTYGSKALQAEGAAKVALLSFGNIKPDGSIIYPDTPTLAYSPEIEDYVVRPGDILFRGRGYAGSDRVAVAAFVDRDQHAEALRQLAGTGSQYCFAYNSSLIRIRLWDIGSNIPGVLDAEYLAAYINSPEAQRYFSKHMKGVAISGVNKSDLLGMPVPLPPMSHQRTLAKMVRTQAEEAKVSSRLSECYGLIINHALSSA